MVDKRVYVTRDTCCARVDVYPATVGIRKFHGCVEYGAAWKKTCASTYLFATRIDFAKYLDEQECRERFGFYPRAGTAWYISESGKRTKVDIDFSD